MLAMNTMAMPPSPMPVMMMPIAVPLRFSNQCEITVWLGTRLTLARPTATTM
ncbi:MAG: hypothetical protein BWX71_00851 [Deltaproteobacteria bacterium ADurb.Bin072]|nr:MAG: hypothetical protein BWX71_00851 [Deltaproteobacteria bacterium ADurb.Bin072]